MYCMLRTVLHVTQNLRRSFEKWRLLTYLLDQQPARVWKSQIVHFGMQHAVSGINFLNQFTSLLGDLIFFIFTCFHTYQFFIIITIRTFSHSLTDPLHAQNLPFPQIHATIDSFHRPRTLYLYLFWSSVFSAAGWASLSLWVCVSVWYSG